MFIKFVCAGCIASHISETDLHFSTSVRKHSTTDKASHIFKHLNSNHRCKSTSSSNCFKTIYYSETTFQLKIKEALHILWDKPVLGAVYIIPVRVRFGMKNNIWYSVYMKVFPKELTPNEA